LDGTKVQLVAAAVPGKISPGMNGVFFSAGPVPTALHGPPSSMDVKWLVRGSQSRAQN